MILKGSILQLLISFISLHEIQFPFFQEKIYWAINMSEQNSVLQNLDGSILQAINRSTSVMECKEYHNLERKVSDIALRKFQLEILAEVWPLVMNMIIDGEIVQGEEFNIKAIYLKQLEKEMALFHKDGSRDDTPGNENSLENALSVIVISDQYFDNLQIAIESLLLLVDGGVKFKTSKKSMMIFDDDMQSQKMLESEVLLESRLVEPGNVKSRFGTTLKTPRGETKDLTSNISKEQAEIQALNQQTLDQLNQSDDKFSSPIEKRLISLEKSVNKLSDKGFNFEIKASERKQQKDFSFKADPNHKLTYELLEGSSKKIEQIKNMLVQKEVRDKLNTDNEMGEDVDDNQAIGLDVATRDNVISMLEEIENRINGYTTKLESTPQQAAKLGQNNNQGVPGNNLFSKQSNALGQNDGGGLFSNNTSININKGGLFGQGAGSMFNKQTANQDKYQQGNQKQNLSLLEQMSQQLYDVQNELKDLKIAADKNQKKYLESINDIGSQKLIRGDTATRQLKFDSESPINLHTPQQFDELKYSRIQQKEDFYSNIQEIIQTTVQTSLQRSLKQTNYRNIEARAPNADEQTNMPFDLGTLKYVIQQSLNRFSTNCLEQKFVLNRNNMKVDKKIKDINPIKFWLYKRLALPEKKEDAVVEADRASKEEGEGDEELSERDEISEFNKTLYTQLNNLLSQVVGSDPVIIPKYRKTVMEEIITLMLNFKNLKMTACMIFSYFIKYAIPHEDKENFKGDLKSMTREIREKYEGLEIQANIIKQESYIPEQSDLLNLLKEVSKASSEDMTTMDSYLNTTKTLLRNIELIQ